MNMNYDIDTIRPTRYNGNHEHRCNRVDTSYNMSVFSCCYCMCHNTTVTPHLVATQCCDNKFKEYKNVTVYIRKKFDCVERYFVKNRKKIKNRVYIILTTQARKSRHSYNP